MTVEKIAHLFFFCWLASVHHLFYYSRYLSSFPVLGQLPAGYTVVGPGMTPQGPLIVNVGTSNGNQPLTIGSQQVQLVQVSTVPTVVQALPGGLIQVTPSGQVTTTGQLAAVTNAQGVQEIRTAQVIPATKVTTASFSMVNSAVDTTVQKNNNSEQELG